MTSLATEFSDLNLDIVLLAAGQSTRLGNPKQHVQLDGTSLLENRLHLARSFREAIPHDGKLIVVSGAYLQEDCAALSGLPLDLHVTHRYNAEWNKGMSTSIACAAPDAVADGVLVMLVDQYQVDLKDLLALTNQWARDRQRPTSSRFANTAGPPVIWPQTFWSEQTTANQRLSKDKLLASNPHFIDVPNAEFDLDTPDDLARAALWFKHNSRE